MYSAAMNRQAIFQSIARLFFGGWLQGDAQRVRLSVFTNDYSMLGGCRNNVRRSNQGAGISQIRSDSDALRARSDDFSSSRRGFSGAARVGMAQK
jgi:hypothetical protein